MVGDMTEERYSPDVSIKGADDSIDKKGTR